MAKKKTPAKAPVKAKAKAPAKALEGKKHYKLKGKEFPANKIPVFAKINLDNQ